MSEVQYTPAQIIAATRRMIVERSEWLEDIVAGLMINGVRDHEIVVCHYTDSSKVWVRGVVRYKQEFHWRLYV